MRYHLLLVLFAVALVLSMTPPLFATTYLFMPIDGPNAYWTEAHGISNNNLIVGAYRNATDDVLHGFSCAGSPCSPLPLNYPGAAQTCLFGVSDTGQFVGGYSNNDYGGCGSGAFLYSGYFYGIFTDLRPPSPGGYTGLGAHGINNHNQVVGTVELNGFLYDIPSGKYTILTNILSAMGINDGGSILASGPSPTFVVGILDSNNTFTPIVAPPAGAFSREGLGINNKSEIVGYFIDSSGSHGFKTAPGGQGPISLIEAKLPKHDTRAYGINDNGVIVGSYLDAQGVHGFRASPLSGNQLGVLTFCTKHPLWCATHPRPLNLPIPRDKVIDPVDCRDNVGFCNDVVHIARFMLSNPDSDPNAFIITAKEIKTVAKGETGTKRRIILGKLSYTKEEDTIKLITPEGVKTLSLTPEARRKLIFIPDNAHVTVVLNEANQIIDIHQRP